MTTLEIVGVIGVLLTALSIVAGVAWRASSALVAVRLEMVRFGTQLSDMMSRPTTWCERQQKECRAVFRRRETSQVIPPEEDF
jgi:hypothetical protein